MRGGFLLISGRVAREPFVDALNCPALARTIIVGSRLEVEVSDALSSEKISVTLYHEVLEAVSVAALRLPAAVCELNEAGLEATARRMHSEVGPASPATLNRMLGLFGF